MNKKKKSEEIFSLFTSFLTDFESFEIEAVKNLSSATTNNKKKQASQMLRNKKRIMNNCSDHSLHLSDVYNMLLYCSLLSAAFLFLWTYIFETIFDECLLSDLKG